MLVVVSNTPMFGANFLVAPNASLEDGLLDISVYPNFSKAEIIVYYVKVMNEVTLIMKRSSVIVPVR
jgi:diacylglycerol kinase family enzyme